MPTRIVSNTGPLITLEKLPDGFAFIRSLYEHILVPRQVIEELAEPFGAPAEYIRRYHLEKLLEVHDIEHIAPLPDISRLDEGGKAAISLAHQTGLELLIEEIKGRKIASDGGIIVSGIAGQIGRACRLGIIEKNDAIAKLQHLLTLRRINREIYTMICGAL